MQSRDALIVAVLVAAGATAALLVGSATAPPDASHESDSAVDAPSSPNAGETPTTVAGAADGRAPTVGADAGRVAERSHRNARPRAPRKSAAVVADADRTGAIATLSALRDAKSHPFGLVGSAEEFARFFERGTSGPALDGTTLTPESTIPDGATITFPAGLHSWSVTRLGRGTPFPKDVLVVGAGMDATIVRVDGIEPDGAVENLTFRDLTIDCSRNSLTDLRSDRPATIRLERCRVIAFDRGAGDESMVAAGCAAFYATDSRFEAGFVYGSDDEGLGALFVVDSGLLVRMERCTVAGPFDRVIEPSAASTYVFAGCTFTNCGEEFAASFAAAPDGARFERCTIRDAAPSAVVTQRVEFLAKVATAGGRPNELLRYLADYHQNLAPLAADRAAFVAFFDRHVNAPAVDETHRAPAAPTPDAATVAFPAGVTTWDEHEHLPEFQGNLLLTGEGIDTTLVRLTDDLECAGLRLRDLTLDVGDGCLPESSERLTAIRIERCRIVGFDTGAGSSSVFASSDRGAVLAEDSRFETGYGRSPQDGELFGGGDAVAARFERCTFRVDGERFGLRDERSALVFSDCRFLDVAPRLSRQFDEPPAGLSLSGCSIEYATATKPLPTSKDDRLSLSDINPAWPKRER